MAPKVAIVIYSMYGHIAKCERLLLIITCSAILTPSYSGRVRQGRC